MLYVGRTRFLRSRFGNDRLATSSRKVLRRVIIDSCTLASTCSITTWTCQHESPCLNVVPIFWKFWINHASLVQKNTCLRLPCPDTLDFQMGGIITKSVDVESTPEPFFMYKFSIEDTAIDTSINPLVSWRRKFLVEMRLRFLRVRIRALVMVWDLRYYRVMRTSPYLPVAPLFVSLSCIANTLWHYRKSRTHSPGQF
jgi:hypothetical protein